MVRATNMKTQVRIPMSEIRTKRDTRNSRGGRWRPAFWSFTIFSERRKNVHENYYNLELQLNAIYANKSTENSHKKKYTQICDKTWVMPKFHLENFTRGSQVMRTQKTHESSNFTRKYTNLLPNQLF